MADPHRPAPLPAGALRAPRHPGHAEVVDSLICEGSIVSSAVLRRVLLGYDCFVHAESVTQDALLLSGCNVGAGALVSNLVCDKNCSIAPDAVIGQDEAADRERFPFITESGIVVLPKGTRVPAEGPIEIAHDMGQAMMNDPATAARLQEFEGRIVFTEEDRHSHVSSGPRYRRYGPGARS
ncbi:MAG: hypothetical protein R3F62_18925 [Planctomycetota bacterium]